MSLINRNQISVDAAYTALKTSDTNILFGILATTSTTADLIANYLYLINHLMKHKLTDAFVRSVRAPDPSGKQKLIWDTELRGFGPLVSRKTNQKSYVDQRMLPGGGSRRITIGAIDEIKEVEKAGDILKALRDGKDPKAMRKSAVTWTLQYALDNFIASNKTRSQEL